MVSFYGDYNLTETVNIPFNTFSSDDPSASVTITNLAGGDVYVHQDGVEGTPTGITVSLNIGAVNGNHLAILDLSDVNDVGFYAVGSRYQVRIEGVTVDGATLNAWIGAFSIGCTLRPTTLGRTLDIQSTGEVDSNLTMIFGSVLSQTNNLAASFKKFFDKATPTGTINSLADAVPGAAGGGFIAGTNAQTTITTSLITGAITLTTPIASNLSQILGTALTETSGYLAAAFKKLFNVATPALVASDVMRGTDSGPTVTQMNAAHALLATPAQVNTEMLDVLQTDTPIDGKTWVESQRITAAACIGVTSGAGTGEEIFLGLDGATTRATVTVDEEGERSAVTYA